MDKAQLAADLAEMELDRQQGPGIAHFAAVAIVGAVFAGLRVFFGF